ncbi:MAG: hypothetical protein ACRCWR_00995 [Saezia sp.]
MYTKHPYSHFVLNGILFHARSAVKNRDFGGFGMNKNDNALKPDSKFRVVMEETEKIAQQMEEEFADLWDLMDETPPTSQDT